ncbi:hypothetical protein JTE90_015230 [Oedothorax gibbosus]|uniref:Uncharacterized protein n=1 Tax=Oedothorax gibbosus TaxID=931172 RepID=A0AAV6V7L3_9ARAC|nr:hypothetical protein JTE90_015230 [Oedothorax gibbosus]
MLQVPIHTDGVPTLALVVWFACVVDPESYAGGSLSYWQGHPSRTEKEDGFRRILFTVEFIRGVLRVPKKCPVEGMGKHNSKLTKDELEELEELTNCEFQYS